MKQYRWVCAIHRHGNLIGTVETVLSYSGRVLALRHFEETARRKPPWALATGDKFTLLERHDWHAGRGSLTTGTGY